MLSPPYVEPHVHMDTCLTVGEPRWKNESGTSWRNIACPSALLTTTTSSLVSRRCCSMASCTYAVIETTDPLLVALDAAHRGPSSVCGTWSTSSSWPFLKKASSFPDGEKLIAEAARRGVDAVALALRGHPRWMDLCSSNIAVSTALDAGLLVDVHCDEIDDEQLALSRCWPHAMHGAPGTGSLPATPQRWAATTPPTATSCSGSCPGPASPGPHPMVNLHLQGRFDDYPKRRGLTQVKRRSGPESTWLSVMTT